MWLTFTYCSCSTFYPFLSHVCLPLHLRGAVCTRINRCIRFPSLRVPPRSLPIPLVSLSLPAGDARSSPLPLPRHFVDTLSMLALLRRSLCVLVSAHVTPFVLSR